MTRTGSPPHAEAGTLQSSPHPPVVLAEGTPSDDAAAPIDSGDSADEGLAGPTAHAASLQAGSGDGGPSSGRTFAKAAMSAGSAAAPSRDRVLVDAARAGDRHAFTELVRRYRPRIAKVALHMVRDASLADDIVQETFVRAYRALAQFDGRSEPYTWIYRIGVNLSLNALRSRKVQSRSASLTDDRFADSLIDAHPASSSPEKQAAAKERHAGLCEALDSLTEILRTTLILVCIDGVSHEQAAAILGIPEGTVAWRIHEARRKLKEHLSSRGWEATD